MTGSRGRDGPGDSTRGGQHGRHEPLRLGSGRDDDRDGRDLPVAHRVTVAAHGGQRAAQHRRLGDRVPRVADERSGEHLLADGMRGVCQQDQADAGRVQWQPAASPGDHMNGLAAADPLEVDGVRAVEHRELHVLVRRLVEILEVGQRSLAQPYVAVRARRDLPQAQADPVATRLVALDGAPVGQLAEQAVGAAQRQRGQPADLGEREPRIRRTERVEDPQHALDDRDVRPGAHERHPSTQWKDAGHPAGNGRTLAAVRTQVGIVGAGPAGLLLSQLLHQQGIESVVLERHDRAYVEHRVRAGVLEHGTAETLREAGVGKRMDAEGLQHEGTELRFARRRHRIDFADLIGRSIVVYGQLEVVKDLIAERLARGGDVRFDIADVRLAGLDTNRPRIELADGSVDCDFVVGADGFHGISRDHIADLAIHERQYPFAWLGILAEAPPSSRELIYTRHERGFALHSMRSPRITRMYLQVPLDDDLAAWPDERIWAELHRRFETDDGFVLTEGPLLDKGITSMRSFVASP